MADNLIIEHHHDDKAILKDGHFTPEDEKIDDVMTEEDTDTEVEEDVVDKPFINLPDNKYENKPEFHPYQNDDMTYHPMFTEEQASSNSKRHQQEINSPNALCPPSHVLKARRLSKNAIQSSTSTPINSSSKTKITRKHSFVDSMNSNSAVSPRFMALRKLSEVTTLPSHSVSYSSVPPVPQIPSIYQQSNDDNNKSSQSGSEFENRIINRIDDVLETQLQFHLGQIAWKSSEGYSDARQFWEEQRKEMFGLASTLIERLETHVDTKTREDAIKEELHEYKARCKVQAESLEAYKKKLDKYKSRYEQEVADHKKKYAEMQQQVEELKAKQAELEKQHKRETDLLKQTNEKNNNAHLETIAQLKESNHKLLNESNKFIKPSSRSASITSELLRKKSLSAVVGGDWADIMESEDEAKKSAEEWALKYRELQASYFDVCLKLEKNTNQALHLEEEEEESKKKDKEIERLKQVESYSRMQIEYLQAELCKYQQRKQRPNTPTNKYHHRKSKQQVTENHSEPGYVTEDGYLIFTTQINGKPSKYSIKLPNNSCR